MKNSSLVYKGCFKIDFQVKKLILMIETIAKAYKAENLIGSYCTAPLRGFDSWFENKIQASTSALERTAWTISHVVSGIFAYLTLGVLALVGIGINLCLIPPANGYSLWARLTGVPKATEEFYTSILTQLKENVVLPSNQIFVFTSRSFIPRFYTYNLNKQQSFDIHDLFENAPKNLIEDYVGLMGEPQNEDLARARLQILNPHITEIQNAIQYLSEQYGWCPERRLFQTINNRVTLVIPVPDHISF